MSPEERTSLVKTGPAPPKLLIERRSEGPVTCLRLSGIIDEQFDGPGLSRTVAARFLILDLGGVERISSFGIRQWIDFVGAMSGRLAGLYFVECAPKIIDQFNMVANFGGPGHIVSFYAPYRCDSCDHDRRRLFRTDEETPLWRAGQAPSFPCQICGSPEYFDEDPATYFFYVAQQAKAPLPPEVASFLKSELSYGQGGQRKLKIEKRIDDRTTFVRLSGDMDSDLRAQKLAEGLEGEVVFDLGGVLSIDPVGAAQWRKLLQLLLQPAGVERIHIVAAPAVFLEKLGRPEDLTQKGQVLSVQVPYTCPRCRATTQRLVDFTVHAAELRAGRVPRTQCGACGAPAACVASETWLQRLAGLPAPQVTEELRQRVARQQATPSGSGRGGTSTRGPGMQLPPVPSVPTGPAAPTERSPQPAPQAVPPMAMAGATQAVQGPSLSMAVRGADTRPLPSVRLRLLQRARQVMQIPGLLPGLLVVLLSLSAAVVYRILSTPDAARRPGGWIFVEGSQPMPPAWPAPRPGEPVFVGESARGPEKQAALQQAEAAALSLLAQRLGEALAEQQPLFRQAVVPLYEEAARAQREELAAAQRAAEGRKDPGAEARLALVRLRVQQGQGRVAALIKGSLSGVTAPLSVKQYWERLARGSGRRQRETAYQATARVELSPQGFQRLIEVYGQDETWQRTRVLPYFPMMGWRHDLAAGAVVAQVEPQSPLGGAGLLPGDVVLAVDDTEVHSLSDFRNALERAAARLLDEGGAAQIKIVRGDRGLALQMTMPRKQVKHRRGR